MKSKYYFYSFYINKNLDIQCKCKKNNFCLLAKTDNLDIIKFINNKGYYSNQKYFTYPANIFFSTNIFENCLLASFINYNLLQLNKKKVINKTRNLKYLLNNLNFISNYDKNLRNKITKFKLFEKYLLFIDYIINYHSVDFAIELLKIENNINSLTVARAKLTKNKKILDYFKIN